MLYRSNITGLGQVADDAICVISLGVEDNLNGVDACLGYVGNPVVRAHGPLIDAVVVVADYLELKVAIEGNLFLSPGVVAIFALDHVIGLVIDIPVAAEDALGTYYCVNHLYRRLLTTKLGSNAVDFTILSIEGDNQAVVTSLSDVDNPVVVEALGPFVSPAVVADNLEAEALGQGNAVSGPSIKAGLSIENHVVVRVGLVPIGAEDGLGTNNGVNRDYNGLITLLVGSEGDFLSLRIEGDKQIISTVCGTGVLIIVGGVAGVPVGILHHLELNKVIGGKLNILLAPSVNTLGQSHVVGSISGIPLFAKDSGGSTGNGVEVVGNLDSGSVKGDLLGLRIEGDVHVVIAVLSNGGHIVGAGILNTPVMT